MSERQTRSSRSWLVSIWTVRKSFKRERRAKRALCGRLEIINSGQLLRSPPPSRHFIYILMAFLGVFLLIIFSFFFWQPYISFTIHQDPRLSYREIPFNRFYTLHSLFSFYELQKQQHCGNVFPSIYMNQSCTCFSLFTWVSPNLQPWVLIGWFSQRINQCKLRVSAFLLYGSSSAFDSQ